MWRVCGAGAGAGAVAALPRRAACSLCRPPPPVPESAAVRHQSTRTAGLLQKLTKRKTKYKKQKKYVELLEVNDKSMTETKASISNLRAVHLSKLASSSVSLGQLHQLTTNTQKKESIPTTDEIDFDLLRTIENAIMKKYDNTIDNDKCALIFTSKKISNFEYRFKNKEYVNVIKDSYNSFRSATIRDQRLKDLSFAINEGLNQEFELDAVVFEPTERAHGEKRLGPTQRKGAHEVFREFLAEYRQTFHVDNFDPEMLEQFADLQSHGIPLPSVDEMYEDSIIHEDISEGREDLDFEATSNIPVPAAKPLDVKKSKVKSAAQRKAAKKKRQLAKEKSMKHAIQDLEKSSKEESLNKLLAAHLQLHCHIGIIDQARQILLHYRTRGKKHPELPKVKDNRIYNILLQGYASKGDYNSVLELLSYMKEDDIQKNIQTYAAVFECIERSQMHTKSELLKQYEEEIVSKGWTLNDIVDKGKFLTDQRSLVLSAIRRLDAAFTPRYTPPELDYVCPLLERLKLENLDADEGIKRSEVEGIRTAEQLKLSGKQQLQNEIRGYIEVENIEVKGEPSATVNMFRKKLATMETEWREVIREAFTRNLSTLKSQSNASHSAITLHPYLTVIEPEQFVDLLMSEVRGLADGSETYSPTLTLLQRDLGARVYSMFQIEQYRTNGVLAKVENLYNKYCEWYASSEQTDTPLNSRQVWQMLMHKNREGACLDTEEHAWPSSVCQNIGKFLYNIIINEVKIDVHIFKANATKQKKLPAVYKVHRSCGRISHIELKPHPLLARLCRGAATPTLRMRAPLVPLTCPPAPWVSASRGARGAYLLTAPPLVRMPSNSVAQWKMLEQAAQPTLYPALDSLNQLGEVPWRVNHHILDLQLEVFRSGGSKELDIARPPSSLDTSEFVSTDSKASAFRRRLAISRARAEMYSLWCDMLYKLSLANHYRDEVFWLPHNMDFRGRVYACPPHLSQLGADPSRALLKFARAEPLGPHGLKWLKLHVINLTGSMKKATLDERLHYADSIIGKILDSADRPLAGGRWWAGSEEPWQTLACCIEIANALRSPDPEAYMCSFPVHQDGSCNGLQHYAALGRDSTGAASVNLAPLARPQDVYSAVANLVEATRVKDAALGVKPALILEGFIRRKVIKQTVMTTVYGVTRFGARLQIAKQLKDINNFPKEHIWACSSYLTTKTFDSLREMFTSTREIQDWFTDCAKLISGVCGESVEWVTPLGLPVVQPYHRRRKHTPGSRTNAGALPEYIPLDQSQRPCTVKQKNAFPPNFIHSLDSSHMMLTSLFCRASRVQFVSVHDCFWTHPSTVDVMNKVCREQFVALHSQPILEDLSEYLVGRYSYPDSDLPEDNQSVMVASKRRVNTILRAVPAKGDFQLENVLKSVYFFS